jgi:hypothetical protein
MSALYSLTNGFACQVRAALKAEEKLDISDKPDENRPSLRSTIREFPTLADASKHDAIRAAKGSIGALGIR